jgi:hypothetical protein
LQARESAGISDNVRNPVVSRFRGSATRSNGAPASGEPPMSPLKWMPPSVFIALCAARMLDSAPRPCTRGWVSMRVAHEAGILTSSPDGAIDHTARSPQRRRPATVPGKTVDDLADLGGIENDSNHRHPASALGTGHDVQFVNLGKQSCPGFPAGGCADLAVQWPALGLILQGPRRRGRLNSLPRLWPRHDLACISLAESSHAEYSLHHAKQATRLSTRLQSGSSMPKHGGLESC